MYAANVSPRKWRFDVRSWPGSGIGRSQRLVRVGLVGGSTLDIAIDRSPIWRKRVGVEPTKDRLAAPPGFEVRTSHRGRFPSRLRQFGLFIRRAVEQVEPVFVD